MSLGELPTRTTMRGYWKCEDVNDSSGNARNLTNLNTVTFNAGKFNNAADYGSSGTNKGLGTTTNIMSALKPTSFTVSLWFKPNSTANIATRTLAQISTAFDSTGSLFSVYYIIAAGVFYVGSSNNLTTTAADTQVIFSSLPSTDEWINVVAVKTDATHLLIYVNGKLGTNNVGSGTETSAAGTYKFTIGNTRSLNGQVWTKVDDVIVEERIWSADEVRRYYTQGKGRYETYQ